MPFKKNEVSKGKILKSALLVFCDNGFKGATIIDIAKKAGVNKALVYYYYQDKEFVFENVIRQNLKKIIKEFRVEVKKIEETPLNIKFLIEIIRAVKNKYKSFFRLLLSELPKDEKSFISNIIVDVFTKEEVNFQSELNKTLAGSGISTEVSLYNRELLVLWLGLLSADLLTEKLIPLLLNINPKQMDLFQKNIDRLITGIQFNNNL